MERDRWLQIDKFWCFHALVREWVGVCSVKYGLLFGPKPEHFVLVYHSSGAKKL
jgi:hypothetical protein